jgi:hypothetical protein
MWDLSLALWTHPRNRAAALSSIYLLSLLSTAAYYMTPSLFRTWYFSSDEYVFAAEVIRFLHLDFRQHFFDIPGTPFMLFTAVLWGGFHALSHMAGQVPASSTLEQFTFEHLPGLFVLMRSLTLFFFLCSLVLMFLIASRLTNRVGGLAASFLLAASHVYASYSSFVRTESLAVCLFLTAVLYVLGERALAVGPQRVFVAGALAGIAAGARLHSITVTLPLLFLLIILTATPHPHYPRWVLWFWSGTAGVILVLGGLALALTRTRTTGPRWFIQAAVIATAVATAVGYLGYASRATRSLIMRLTAPNTVLLLIGAALGLAVGIPTIFAQWKHFVQSFVMYTTTYRDFDREDLSFLANSWWVVKYYVSVIAPDRSSLVLFVIGTVSVLAAREKRLVAVLAGALLFFLSKPLNLRAAPHHVILWLPLFAVVSAYPIAKAWDLTSGVRGPARRLCCTLAMIAVAAMLLRGMNPGFTEVGRNVAYNEQRMRNVAVASDWIKHNTKPDSIIAVAYFCFNPGVFYAWLRALQVPVPGYVFDGREYVIWWGNRSALAGKTGYALATRSDVKSLKNRTDEVSPGDGTDPFTDENFTFVKSFGDGSNAVSLFRFSFQMSPPPSSGHEVPAEVVIAGATR